MFVGFVTNIRYVARLGRYAVYISEAASFYTKHSFSVIHAFAKKKVAKNVKI